MLRCGTAKDRSGGRYGTRTQGFKQLAKIFQILQLANDAIRTGASSSRTHFVRLRTKLALLIYFTAAIKLCDEPLQRERHALIRGVEGVFLDCSVYRNPPIYIHIVWLNQSRCTHASNNNALDLLGVIEDAFLHRTGWMMKVIFVGSHSRQLRTHMPRERENYHTSNQKG